MGIHRLNVDLGGTLMLGRRGGVEYLLRDEFKTDRTAGNVNGGGTGKEWSTNRHGHKRLFETAACKPAPINGLAGDILIKQLFRGALRHLFQ